MFYQFTLHFFYRIIDMFWWGILYHGVISTQNFKMESKQTFTQSQVYLDEQINNIGGLLDDGSESKIAHLLDPENQRISLTF